MDTPSAPTRWKFSKAQRLARQKRQFWRVWVLLVFGLIVWQTVQWYQIVLLNAAAYKFPSEKINLAAWESDLYNGFTGNISTQLRALWQTEGDNLWAVEVYDAAHELSMNFPEESARTFHDYFFVPKISGHWQEIELTLNNGKLIGYLRYAVRHDYARDPAVRIIRSQNAYTLLIEWVLFGVFCFFLLKQDRAMPSSTPDAESWNTPEPNLPTTNPNKAPLLPRWQLGANEHYARTGRILDQFEVGFVVLDSQGCVQFLSYTTEKLLRIKAAEVQGKLLRNHVDFYHEDGGETCLSTADRCLRGDGVLLQDQLAIRVRDMQNHQESYSQLDVVAVLQLDMAQRTQNVFMMLREAGKYSPDKQYLRDEIEQYKKLFELLPMAVLWCDAKADIVHTNPALSRLTGFSHDSLSEQRMASILHCDSWRKPHLDLVRAAEERLPVQAVLKTIDERDIHVQVHISRAPMINGFSLMIQTIPTNTVATPANIPLAHQTMQDLFTHLLESSDEEIYILDAKKLRCLEASARAATHQRRSMDELIDLHLQEISPSLRMAVQHHQKNSHLAHADGSLLGEYAFVRADHTQYRVQARVLFVPHPDRPLLILYAHSVDAMANKKPFYHVPN